MIDNFALGLTHGLMMLAAIILLRRPDLDAEPSARPSDPAGESPTTPVAKPGKGRWRA